MCIRDSAYPGDLQWQRKHEQQGLRSPQEVVETIHTGTATLMPSELNKQVTVLYPDRVNPVYTQQELLQPISTRALSPEWMEPWEWSEQSAPQRARVFEGVHPSAQPQLAVDPETGSPRWARYEFSEGSVIAAIYQIRPTDRAEDYCVWSAIRVWRNADGSPRALYPSYTAFNYSDSVAPVGMLIDQNVGIYNSRTKPSSYSSSRKPEEWPEEFQEALSAE